MYATDADFLINLRNGCTLFEINRRVVWGRRALPHIFKYQVEQLDRRNDKVLALVWRAILGRVRYALSKGNRIEVVKA